METTNATTEQMLQNIEKQATGFTGYNPVAKVICPHCDGRLQAIDAKTHVRTMAEK